MQFLVVFSKIKLCLDPVVIFHCFNIVKNSYSVLHDSKYLSTSIWYFRGFILDNVSKHTQVFKCISKNVL